jgi:glutaredoxin
MKVKVYSLPACGACNHLKDFLKEEGVEYEELNVADQTIAKEMVEKSGQMSLPVTIVEVDGKEEVLLGYNEDVKNKIKSLKG